MTVQEPRARWRDLAPRAASALIMMPLSVAAIWAGGLTWQLVLTALALIAWVEWALICNVPPMTALARSGAAAIVIGLACHATLTFFRNRFDLRDLADVLPGILPFAAVVLAAFWMLPSRRPLALGMAYVGLGWASLLVLREADGGMRIILFIMTVVWANDIGAYLAGRLIGGPRLAPALSPGKTWAGALGGFATGIAAGIALMAAMPRHPPWPGVVAQAAFLAIAAQAGDLLESAIKRHYGKKDSGALIPGHGGLLDRVDGLLAASSAAMLVRLAAIASQGMALWQ